jgi:hypothetical protein
MKDITPKQNKEFKDRFIKLVKEFGARELPESLHSSFVNFELDTRVGLLTIHLPKEQSSCYAVFSMFQDAGIASKEFDCNPHSGKYNMFLSKTALSPSKMAEVAASTFKLTLPKDK